MVLKRFPRNIPNTSFWTSYLLCIFIYIQFTGITIRHLERDSLYNRSYLPNIRCYTTVLQFLMEIQYCYLRMIKITLFENTFIYSCKLRDIESEHRFLSVIISTYHGCWYNHSSCPSDNHALVAMETMLFWWIIVFIVPNFWTLLFENTMHLSIFKYMFYHFDINAYRQRFTIEDLISVFDWT